MLPASISRPTSCFWRRSAASTDSSLQGIIRGRSRAAVRPPSPHPIGAFVAHLSLNWRPSVPAARLGRSAEMKVSRYQSTISSPNQSPTIPPSARNGPNGIARLRASDPWRAISATPDQRPGGEADQQRRGNRAPEVQAHHRGQLDVAHPHSARVGERDQQSSPPPAAAAAIARSAEVAGVGGGDDRDRGDRAREHDRVRDQLQLEVGERDRHAARRRRPAQARARRGRRRRGSGRSRPRARPSVASVSG